MGRVPIRTPATSDSVSRQGSLSSRYLTVLIESFEHITVKLVKVTHSGKFKQRLIIVGELLGEGS